MPKQDIDRPVAPTQIQNRGNGKNYILVAIVSVLATLGLVASGLWLSQFFGSREAMPTASTESDAPANTQATAGSSEIQPGQFVQTALGNKAQVELTAVRRIPGVPDEVSVEMRINRLAGDVAASDMINVGSTGARNPLTNETYQGVDFFKRSSGTMPLSPMNPGQPVEGYVVLKVPAGVRAIDIFVPEAEVGVFKNVPIADASQIPSADNNSSLSSSPIQSPLAPVPQSPTTQVPQVAPNTSIGVQPGQFVQPAFGTKGQVELLSVKRIQDPDTGASNVVNVQMRIRRIEPDRVYGSDAIYIGGTTARNPETSETHKVAGFDRSTGSVSLFSMRPGASADAYVWLRVPEGTNTIDIYVPDTQAFKNVPIAN